MLINITCGDDSSFTEICRQNGWKRTIQRRAVFNCLCGNRSHPSVETVWTIIRQHIPDVSLDSVYRILDDFSAAGIIRRLDGGKVIRYDSDTGQHGHFTCVRCAKMYDFDFTEAERAAQKCDGFGSIIAVEMNVRGICKDCQTSEDRREE